jgi:dUTP pyrophosphatase
VFIQKIRQDAKLPQRSNPSDAGADVFYCGDDPIIIYGGESKLLGTGIRIATPHGYVTEVKNRSGMAAKRSLIVGACIIDSGYEGELMINLHNVGNKSQEINPGDKIAQLLVYRVELPSFEELPNDVPLYSKTQTDSSRGEGGFGSTGC